MQIYISSAGNQQGPYSIEEVNKLAQSEPITGDDLCWYKGCAEWIPLSHLPGFIPILPQRPTAGPQASAITQTSATDTLYYLLQNNEQAGPYTIGQLRAMWQNGNVTAQTHYCFAGGTNWQPLIKLRTMLEPVPGTPAPISRVPSAGANSPAKQSKNKKRNIAIVSALAAVVLVAIFASHGSNRATSENSTAATAAQQIVRNSLKSPSSAVFKEITILDRKGNKYLIKTALDAQNSFGAMIRGEYLVVLTLTGGTKFDYNTDFAAMEVNGNYTEKHLIDLVKGLNGWDESPKK